MGSQESESPFRWSVGVTAATFAHLSNIKLDQFYLDPSACVEALRTGRKRVREIFGEEVTLPTISCPPVSYGHIACLGVKVLFPEDSEPGVRPIYTSLDEGIEALRRGAVFEQNDLFKHYLKIYHRLQREFPDEKVVFGGFGWEGPITSAVLLRGQDFYMDLYDEPEKAREFLGLLTENIIQFIHFIRKINGEPPVSPYSSGLADDFSSLIHPDFWPDFVIPYWEQYYSGITTGARTIHVENLSPEHLKYLEMASISFYDPSISPKLTVRIIKERINIPFTWRFPGFSYLNMSREDIRQWVLQAVADGARDIHTIIESTTCEGDNPEKVRVFIETAKTVG